MSSSQLPVDATQGRIVPVTRRGVRLFMQPEVVKLSLPIVTAG